MATYAGPVRTSPGKGTGDDVDISSTIIQHLRYLEDDSKATRNTVSETNDRLASLEDQMQSLGHLVESTFHRVNALSRRPQVKPSYQKKGKLGREKLRRQHAAKTDVSRLLHFHEALQENIDKFVDNLSFHNTSLPDRLVDNECLTEDECSVIRSYPNPKDETRHLIRTIARRGPEVINTFVELLGEDGPNSTLKTSVLASLARISEQNKNKPICIVCVMKKSVNLKDIADILWKNKVISVELYDRILDHDGYVYREQLWQGLLKELCEQADQEKTQDVLLQSLEKKYKYIREHLGDLKIANLRCLCKGAKKKMMLAKGRSLCDFSDSQTEFSTTSEMPRFDRLLYSEDSSDTDSRSNSLDQSQGSFANIFAEGSNPNILQSETEPQGTMTMMTRSQTVDSGISSLAGQSVGATDFPNTHSFSTRPVDTLISDTNPTDPTTSDTSSQATSPAVVPSVQLPLLDADNMDDQSYMSVGFSTADSAGGGSGLPRPEVERSISTTTVVAAGSGSSEGVQEDKRSLDFNTDTSGGSPTEAKDISMEPAVPTEDVFEEDKDKNLIADVSGSINGPMDDSGISLTPNPSRKQRRRHRTAESKSTLTEACNRYHSDDEDDFDMAYARMDRHQRKRDRKRRGQFRRQLSEPVGEIKTESRKLEPLSANIGTRIQEHKLSKASIKREQRRQRKLSTGDPEAANASSVTDAVPSPKLPYNPLWTKVPQSNTMMKWDYLQARRHWLIAHKYAASSDNVRGSCRSDTDVRVDDSDSTVVYSEHTV